MCWGRERSGCSPERKGLEGSQQCDDLGGVLLLEEPGQTVGEGWMVRLGWGYLWAGF